MGQRRFKRNMNYTPPSGFNSIFDNVYLDFPNTIYPDDITPEDKKYTYQVIECESGLEVFEKYNSGEYQPEERFMYVFVEKSDNDKSNFFGTACRVIFDDLFKELLIELSNNKSNVSIHDSLTLTKDLKSFCRDISSYHKNLEEDVLYSAINLELVGKNKFNQVLQSIFQANNKLADWMRSGVEAMEKWKFTEENYDYEKYFAKPMYNKVNGFSNEKSSYKPIIPVANVPFYKSYSNSNKIAETGLKNLITLGEKFEEISFAVVYNTVKATPNITDDIFYAVVFYIKNYLEEYILGRFKDIFKEIKGLIQKATLFIKEIASKTADFHNQKATILNAFLCGLINGIVSLFQTIVIIIAFVVDNISILELEKTSKTEISKHEEKLEFVEDLIDLLKENTTELFSGIISFVIDSKLWTETTKLIDDIWKSSVNAIKNTNRYFWAYVLGAILFEVVLDVVIAFFTGGTSLAVKVSAKISLLASKADDLAKAGIKTTQKVAKKVADSASDLYKWVKSKIEELIQAIKSGKLIDWIREQLHKTFRVGKKAELKLRGETIILKGFKWKKIKYVKRTPAETAKLRNKFGNSERKKFIDELLKKPNIESKLKKSGLSDDDIKLLKDGGIPDDWSVHHKLPLDDGGTNDFKNLMLIKDEPYHKSITAYQITSTKGMQPKEIIDIEWPMFDGFLYP